MIEAQTIRSTVRKRPRPHMVAPQNERKENDRV